MGLVEIFHNMSYANRGFEAGFAAAARTMPIERYFSAPKSERARNDRGHVPKACPAHSGSKHTSGHTRASEHDLRTALDGVSRRSFGGLIGSRFQRRDIVMTPSRDIGRLIEIMAALRTPKTGCPWDLEQTSRPSRLTRSKRPTKSPTRSLATILTTLRTSWAICCCKSSFTLGWHKSRAPSTSATWLRQLLRSSFAGIRMCLVISRLGIHKPSKACGKTLRRRKNGKRP